MSTPLVKPAASSHSRSERLAITCATSDDRWILSGTGPETTVPVSELKRLSWQRQGITPRATEVTVQQPWK